ncbi:MAG: beta-propeller domain-containing protein, partial [Catonella sp.]
LVDAAKNLIGFPVSYYSSAKRRQINQYVIYGFDKEKGFYERFRADFPEFDSYGGSYRGLYIGSHFYIVAANIDEVLSFDMKTGQLVEKLDY